MALRHKALTAISLSLALPAASASARITLDFDYSLDTLGFFTRNPQAKTALEEAGRVFTDRFTDTLSAITPNALNTYDVITFHPNNPDGAEHVVRDLPVPANTLKIFVGSGSLGGALGIGGPGGYDPNVGPLSDEVYHALSTRGQLGIDPAAPQTNTDFATWGGSITFEDNFKWHFGVKTLPPSNQHADFYSVAVHELGHLFGFGTAASFENLVQGNGSFVGPESMALHGGPVPTSFFGSHWDEDVESLMPDGTRRETAMDPVILVGGRKFFTPLDFAGMDDLGWDLATPGDANLDGAIDISDYFALDRGGAMNDLGFRNGDFDGDGGIDATDFMVIDRAFMAQGGASAALPRIAAVPEPAAVLSLLALAGGLAQRIGRRSPSRASR